MKEKKRVEFPVNGVRLCFDNYDHEQLNGRICGVALAEEIHFHGMTDFVVKIDDAFNQIGRPQPTQVLRSFGEGEPYQSYKANPPAFFTGEEIATRAGKLMTLDLTMASRQRAEWQGFLKDIKEQKATSFATILECIKIIEKISNNYNIP